jgi:phosphoribosylglycinamide formyltransferase-1
VLTVAVLISGTGSNLRALLEAAADPAFPARIVVVGADREAEGFAHAEAFGIPTFLVPFREFETREQWGEELDRQLRVWNPDLVVLSGLMRLLPASVVDAWAPRIINTHPAYLPEFPGAHGVRDALAAGVTQTGASVIVVDNGVDSGPILAQERVAVLPDDTEQSLHERIKPVERRLLIDVVRAVASGELELSAVASDAAAS